MPDPSTCETSPGEVMNVKCIPAGQSRPEGVIREMFSFSGVMGVSHRSSSFSQQTAEIGDTILKETGSKEVVLGIF